MPKQRDDDGRFTSSVSDRDILQAFDSGDRPFYSAGEIAVEFDFDRSQAHRRLVALGEDGELERVAVGERNVVWWRPRDAVVFVDEGDGDSVLDTTTGVASQGRTRPQALRMLAEALESHAGATDVSPGDVCAELGIDPDDVDDDAPPPWDR
jgi:hypothetical protein